MHANLRRTRRGARRYTGLDDVMQRAKAAAEISSALTTSLPLKLLVVVTLEAGAVRAADLATIDALPEALEKTGVDVRDGFTVLVNKCVEDAEGGTGA